MFGLSLAILGATSAVILAGIGSAVGIGSAASVASGALSENPKNFAKYLMLVALPGTQGIYGFIIGFLIIVKLGILAGKPIAISTATGLQFLFGALAIALTGLVSAIYQGRVCASGIEWVSKHPDNIGQALIFGVFVEFYAILGLLISIFIWLGITV